MVRIPLSEVELRVEAQVQLRRLAQSPGWALLQMRLQRCSQRNEAEKASLLRESLAGKEARAAYLQGLIDGLKQVETELSQSLKETESVGVPLY